MKRSNVLRSLVAVFLFSQISWGAVPQLINFQGVLKDGSGNPVANGSYSVTFTIYDAATSGNVKWQETQSVSTVNGLFTVLLGAATPVPDSVFYDTTRYLGIAVSPDPEMVPRQRLSSVGYSSVSSQWTSAGENLFRLNGKVGIGESNPLNTLTIGSNGGFTSTGLFPGILMGTTSFQTKQLIIGRDEANFVQLAYADEDPSPFARLLVEGNHPLYISTGGSMALVTQANNPLELYTNGTARMHITGDGKVGIGTTSPASPLEVFYNNNSATTPAIAINNATGFQNVLDFQFGGVTQGRIRHANGGGLVVGTVAPLELILSTGNVGRMYITPAGNVGVGTNSPQSTFQVVGGYIHLPTTAGAPPAADCDAGSEAGRMIYDSAGNVLYICDGTAWQAH